MLAIRSIKKVNYLGEKGLKPDKEQNGVCYFRKCPKLYSLLESYDIETVFRNK